MKMRVIGCDAAYAKAGGATSAYLVESNGTKVLLDCGSGSMSKLQSYINISELDALFISHYHRDHYADLECLHVGIAMEMELGKRDEKLVIYGPGQENIINYKEACTGLDYRNEKEIVIGDMKFTFSKNQHGREAYSIKVTDKNNKVIVYTGDTGYYEELTDFCENADLLIADSSFYEEETGKSNGHMSSIEIGELATQSNVKEVILTHLPHHGDNNQLILEAKKKFKGSVKLADYGMLAEV